MSDTRHSPIALFTLGITGWLRCTCGFEERFCIQAGFRGSDFEEIEQLACDSAGWSEQGFCPKCAEQDAIEAKGEAQRIGRAVDA